MYITLQQHYLADPSSQKLKPHGTEPVFNLEQVKKCQIWHLYFAVSGVNMTLIFFKYRTSKGVDR